MLERRQNLAFGRTARRARVGEAHVHDLDGHPLLELLVGAVGLVDRAMPPRPARAIT